MIILKSPHIKDEPLKSDKNKQTIGEYIIANYFIDKLRYLALTENYLGPRILIIGSPSSGEREFCHTLINYSLKLGYTPIFCDLDLDNEISVPGCISASVVDHLVPNDFLFDNGLSFFTGAILSKRNENMNWSLYEMQLVELGNICIEKLEQDCLNWKKSMNIINENKENKISFISPPKPTLFASGLIVNCPIIENDEQAKNIYKTIKVQYSVNEIESGMEIYPNKYYFSGGKVLPCSSRMLRQRLIRSSENGLPFMPATTTISSQPWSSIIWRATFSNPSA